MAERHISVRPGPWAASLLVIALSACSTTPGRQAPVDDVSVGGRAPQGVVSPGAGQGVPGEVTGGAPSGGSISGEDISSDDLMDGAFEEIPLEGAVLPRENGVDRNLAMANQSAVISNLMQSADTAYTERRWEEAASVLERALRIEPGNGLLWQRLAEVRFAQGDYLQTIQLASKSDALAGSNRILRTDNLILMIEAYEAMGDFDRADALRQNASDRVNRTSR